ncbi:MAG: S53 family peptidase [Sciscionella sp.]|nr:S53 family peptidase [Sciscionella sp.]
MAVTGVLALAVASTAAGFTGAVTANTASAGGVKTPAIGISPRYLVAGQVTADPSAVTFGCQTTTPAGCYGPSQIRAAYGVDKLANRGVTGKGRNIVIIDSYQSPTINGDLQTFDKLFGLSDPVFNIVAPDGLTPFDQSDKVQTSWAGEITLDVEWSHVIAPDAHITLVLAKTSNDADILSATRYAVQHKLGDVISQSFGEAEQCMDPTLLKQQNALFTEAVHEGITLFASAGDQGSAQPTCDNSSYFKSASTPASDPNVTSVGGTRLDADGLTGAYHTETVWNEPDFTSAGGGGYSVVYGTPSYQRSLHLPARGVPDVAYNAAIIGGVLTVWSTSGQGANLVFRFGGTSAGSPQWAGLTVLADQLAGHDLGAIDNALYGLAHGRQYGSRYHDVTVGDNTYHGTSVTVPGFQAGPGWDPASGLGSPQADVLIPALASNG